MTNRQAARLRDQLLDSLAALHDDFEFFAEAGPVSAALAGIRKAKSDARAAAILDELLELLDDEEDDEPNDDELDVAEAAEFDEMSNPASDIGELVAAVAGGLAPVALQWLQQKVAPVEEPAGPVPVPPTPTEAPGQFWRDRESGQKGTPGDDEKVIEITDFRPVE